MFGVMEPVAPVQLPMILPTSCPFQLSEEMVSNDQAERVTQIEEGQFSEVKARSIAASKLSHTISAFANSDGGDLYIGISEELIGGGVKARKWDGFQDIEAANGHLQSFEQLFPLGTDFQYEFLHCDGRPGLVLHVQVSRTQSIMKAIDGNPHVRRGAQNIPVTTAEALRRLEYAKGVISFESESVNTSKAQIIDSPVTLKFLQHVIPSAEPESWLRKQSLLRDERPSVGGLLLFSEEPQAALPKRCGIKVYRYKTQEAEGFRDVLAFNPITVEGCLYSQIKEAIAVTILETEKIPRVGTQSLETIKYPPETLHEIIANAVIHRDYSIADDIHIRIFDNRVEVQSPGRLPAHVTVKNILNERFARNGAVVRLLNKFPDPPNRDVGEGLNTAFEKMNQLGLKAPSIEERDNDVLVTIRHEPLASPEEAILRYLEEHETIKNKTARGITHVKEDYRMKKILSAMADRGMIEPVPGARFGGMAYQKKTQGLTG
jgi:ATP-dependent DNA helicase RecG